MEVTLYGIPPSPPSHSVRLMLERKGIAYKSVSLLPGLHPALLRTRGFRGGTVPAMKIDGRKLQNSRAISRALEDAQPEPPLFPADPEQRIEVEEAERWGEEDFQNLPRRIVRWLAVHRPQVRLIIARDVGIPLPSLAARANAPVAWVMAKKVDAERHIRESIARVPEALSHIDRLIATGVIGGDQPNAADFQIATSVRSLLSIQDLRPGLEGRPAADLAMRILPELGSDFPAGMLPGWWLAPLSRGLARSLARPTSA
jgi:glutathione S-transferase